MKILRKSSEAEMIWEYLKAEYTSERFSGKLKQTLNGLKLSEELILKADIHSEEENRLRRILMGEYRGYGRGKEMFERFPDVAEWYLCSFGREDLPHIRYIDYSYWNELSAGTHLPINAVETIQKGRRIYEQSNERFVKGAEYIRAGGGFPKMFFLTADYERYVIVEGHLRMTAYALAEECFEDVEVIVGVCGTEELNGWM